MNREDIIRLAREARLSNEIGAFGYPYLPELERFAALVAAAEREACEDIEDLRRDAERYRWLRNEHSRIDPCIKANAKYRLERDSSTWVNIHDLDAAIDAAMKEDKP